MLSPKGQLVGLKTLRNSPAKNEYSPSALKNTFESPVKLRVFNQPSVTPTDARSLQIDTQISIESQEDIELLR